jgi:7-cyano-7-deazaguanine synthase
VSNMRKAVAIVSGGLDSVTMAYLLSSQGYSLCVLGFDYGQRHRKELDCAELCAKRLCAKYHRVDLTSLIPLLRGSSLTDDIDVPDGHYAEESMRITVVPNRNAVMLSIAFSAAVSFGADLVATGVHSGDHFVYPDCRPEFIEAFDAMEQIANKGFGHSRLRLLASFVDLTKSDIVRIGDSLSVPFQNTWSCYKGQDVHCGTCGTCVERKEAFDLANISDPTAYLA